MRPSIRRKELNLKNVTWSKGKFACYYYYRKNGIKTPLGKHPDENPDFWANYAQAVAGAAQSPKRKNVTREGSIAALCAAFKDSTTYQGYSNTYKATLARHMDKLCSDPAKAAAKITDLRAIHIRSDISELDPHAGRNRLKMWRCIARFAFDRGMITTEPTDGVRRPAVPKTEGFPPWSAQDIAAYRDRWAIGTAQRLCMELAYWTAARTVDAVTLSHSMVGTDGVLTFRQSKTGDPAHVPWACQLPDWAGGFEADREHLFACLDRRRFTFLETASGQARSVKGLGNIISAGAQRAGLVGRSAHGLRKSRLTAIAEAGGSASAIMSWGGHRDLAQAQHYIQSADRKSLVTGTEQDRNSANTPAQSANTK